MFNFDLNLYYHNLNDLQTTQNFLKSYKTPEWEMRLHFHIKEGLVTTSFKLDTDILSKALSEQENRIAVKIRNLRSELDDKEKEATKP